MKILDLDFLIASDWLQFLLSVEDLPCVLQTILLLRCMTCSRFNCLGNFNMSSAWRDVCRDSQRVLCVQYRGSLIQSCNVPSCATFTWAHDECLLSMTEYRSCHLSQYVIVRSWPLRICILSVKAWNLNENAALQRASFYRFGSFFKAPLSTTWPLQSSRNSWFRCFIQNIPANIRT